MLLLEELFSPVACIKLVPINDVVLAYSEPNLLVTFYLEDGLVQWKPLTSMYVRERLRDFEMVNPDTRRCRPLLKF